ncbi:MAG: tetratricopeptide repeat protein, partial [Bacteroidota bacterium]
DAAMPDKLRQYSTKGINGTNQDGSSIYLTAKEVSLTALAGVQYYNVGVHFFEKGQYEQAISNFQKSSLLYPNFRSEEGIRTALMAQMVAQDYNETAAVENIAQLAQLAFDEHTRSFLVKGFTGFSNEKLHLQEDLEAFKQGYFTIFQRASKEETRIVLQSFYFFEVGRYYYERSEFEKSERLFKKAHELTPNIRGLSNAWLSAKQRIDSDMRVARNE